MTIKDVTGLERGSLPSKTSIWVDEILAKRILKQCKSEGLYPRQFHIDICQCIQGNHPYNTKRIYGLDILRFIKHTSELYDFDSSESQTLTRWQRHKQKNNYKKYDKLRERVFDLLFETTHVA